MDGAAFRLGRRQTGRTMGEDLPKIAIVAGQEGTLVECVAHLADGGETGTSDGEDSVVIFKLPNGDRRYATLAEWQAGARMFAEQAAKLGIVTSDSPARDKIALFRSLFKGREDAFAHGYKTKKGDIGYVLTCTNEWVRGICPKCENHRFPCATCEMRATRPLSDRDLVDHFAGRREDFHDVVGLYVLDEDCRTCVLVADFDDAGWQDQSAAYIQAAGRAGIFTALERSRSGNGGHVWIFFSEPVDASLARGLGSALMTQAMQQSHVLKFDSYDRFFPAQSTIVKGGYGNLISLPFQGRAQRQGNSVFVDESLQPFEDQWRFLSSVRRTTPEQAREIVDSVGGHGLGRLAQVDDGRTPAKAVRASNSKTAKAPVKSPLQRNDFPASLHITKSNMIFVDKAGLSPRAQDAIRRLAVFGNPEFYRAQAMFQNVYGKPRVIDLHAEDDVSIGIPRGAEKRLFSMLSQLDVPFDLADKRCEASQIDVSFRGALRPPQQKAAASLLANECGILSAPTGFGKTVVGAYLIGFLRRRTLVIVPRTALVSQWHDQLGRFLDIREERKAPLTKSGRPSRRKLPLIGQIGGGKNAPSGIVDIATFQALFEHADEQNGPIEGARRVKELISQYDLVICDECHHAAAPQLERVLSQVNAHFVYGLSATPRRADRLESIIYLQCGPIRHVVSPKEHAEEQGMDRLLVPRFTCVRLPQLEPGSSFNQILDALCAHTERNREIADDTAELVRAGSTPLVITRRKSHAGLLAQMLEERHVKAFVLTGEGSARQKRDLIEQVKAMPDGESFAVVATGSYIGEGFDDSRLDALMLATPASWEGVITQYTGRLHRTRPGKDKVKIYDYIDTTVAVLDRMYSKRLKTYKKLGYKISEDASKDDGSVAEMVDAGAFFEKLAEDFDHADKEILVSTPYLAGKRLDELEGQLGGAVRRGAAVRVKVGPLSNDRFADLRKSCIARLMGLGCEVKEAESGVPCLTIIDDRLVWYGAIAPLGNAGPEDCSLRLASAEVADDLRRTVFEMGGQR